MQRNIQNPLRPMETDNVIAKPYITKIQTFAENKWTKTKKPDINIKRMKTSFSIRD